MICMLLSVGQSTRLLGIILSALQLLGYIGGDICKDWKLEYRPRFRIQRDPKLGIWISERH